MVMCVHTKLLPHLNPFNGFNAHLIVFMDNASIHLVDDIVDVIQQVGAMVMFLPPYLPDFNPIELLFKGENFQVVCNTMRTVNDCAFCHVTSWYLSTVSMHKRIIAKLFLRVICKPITKYVNH